MKVYLTHMHACMWAQGIKYSPTFHVYRRGQLVDRVLGKEEQRLADHLWLHQDD